MSHPSSAPQILSPNLIPWLLDQASTAMLTICQSRVGDGLHPVQGPIVPLGSTGFLLWGRSSRWTPSCSRDPVPVIQLRLSPLCGYMGPFVLRGFSLCLPRPFITPIMVVYIQETGRFRIKWARTLTWESKPPLGASVSPSVPGAIPAIPHPYR